MAAGAVVKATPLTEAFDYSAFCRRYGESQIPLFVIDEEKNLFIVSSDRPAQPGPGQTLVSLIDADAPRFSRSPAAP